MALRGDENAWKVLLADVTIGFGAWARHRIVAPALVPA
jgi:hypothetical protein